MVQMKIDMNGVRETMHEMADAFNDFDLGGVASDIGGTGDDERSPFLAACVRNCQAKPALDEIIAYMSRLRTEIEKYKKHEHYNRFVRIWNNARSNLDKCLVPVQPNQPQQRPQQRR